MQVLATYDAVSSARLGGMKKLQCPLTRISATCATSSGGCRRRPATKLPQAAETVDKYSEPFQNLCRRRIPVLISSAMATLTRRTGVEKIMKIPCPTRNSTTFLGLFLSFSLLLLQPFLISPSQAISPTSSSSEYVRPGPRGVIFTPPDRPRDEPQQVHVSLAGKDYVTVSWVTESQNASSAATTVAYGKESGKYTWTADGDSLKYRYFFYTSGRIHHAKIGPLEPATTYYYQCGGVGPEFSFRTPPSTFPIEFVVVGDLGQTEWTKSTLEHVAQADYDVFLLPGDLSYADTNQHRWDSFGRLVEPYASRRPWMVTEGNHEIESIPFFNLPKPFLAYNARWVMPYEASGSSSNLYYSFEVAGAHIIMLGSYVDYSKDSGQYRWLQADLAGVDRSKTSWVFALLHVPWYNSNEAHTGEGEEMRKAMEELLYKGRVDVVFAGHVHAYERFTRVYDNKADPCGPVYITIGDGGNREGLAMSFESLPPSISMFREPSFGHGRLSVIDGTKARWAWQRNNDSDATVADEVRLHSLSSNKACWPDDLARGKDGL